MKINSSHLSKALIACVLLINCGCLFAQNNSEPEFKGLAKAKELQFQDWISVKHFGPEDKPMQEFVITFTTGAASIKTIGNVSVVSLPKVEMLPMIKFVQAKENSESIPNYKEGMFRVRLYSRAVVKWTYYMDRDQSLSFFNYLNVIMRRHTELNEKSKYGFKRTLNFLNGLKKQDLK